MVRKFVPLLVIALTTAIGSQAFGQGGFGEADANQDKKIDSKEFKEYVAGKLPNFKQFKELFSELDTDGDKAISEKEFANRRQAVQKLMRGQSGADAQPRGRQNQRTRQRPTGLKVGQEAPTFKLKALDGESETDLASFRGKKPVVLIFGSYS